MLPTRHRVKAEVNVEKGVPIRTVSRSIHVLRLINRENAVTLMEIARATQLPYPTAYRIVQTLLHEGLIECEPTRKRYRVTGKVRKLSQGYCEEDNLVTLARPFIVALTLLTEWPVTVTIGIGSTVMIRDSTYELSALSLSRYPPGYTLGLLDCAAGHVHLAWMDPVDRESILDTLAEQEGDSEVLRSCARSAQIRAAGFAQHERSIRTANPGQTSSLAAPICVRDTEQAQLTLSYFSAELQPCEAVARYAEPLMACAKEISAALQGIRRQSA